jgi:hypothetical protein
MEVTKSTRFNASKRPEGRQRRMALAIALPSLTFMSTAYRLPPMVVTDVDVVASVFDPCGFLDPAASPSRWRSSRLAALGRRAEVRQCLGF